MPPSRTYSTDLDRKTLKREDGFVKTVRGQFDRLSKHTYGMAALAGIVVLAGVGATLLYNQRENQSAQGREALFRAQRSVEKALEALAPPPVVPPVAAQAKKDSATDKTPPPAPKPDLAAIAHLKLDVDAKLAEGVKAYQGVIQKYDGTRPAVEARIALADLYYNHGEPAKAVPLYQAAADHSSGTFERALAFSSVGYAQENAGKPKEAQQAYEKALNLGETSLKGDLLLAMARCYQALNDNAKARTTYDQISSQLPNTEYAKKAESLKADLH